MPRYRNYNLPVRSFVAVRPRDQFTVTGLAVSVFLLLLIAFALTLLS